MVIKIPRCARDFACGLPLSRLAGSLTPATRLKMAAVAAFNAEIVDELLEPSHVLGLAGDEVENLLFSEHGIENRVIR
jgi:hypothetical protein